MDDLAFRKAHQARYLAERVTHSFPTADCPEIALLLACVRPDDDGDDDGIEVCLRRNIDWTLLVQTALAHRVSPLVADRLSRVPPGYVPEELRAALSSHLRDNRERNIRLTDALFELLDALRDRNVVALPFKGQTLAALVNGDFTIRRAGDLDVLMRREDLSKAWAVLEALGYRELTEFEIGRPMTATEHAGCLRYQCEYAFHRKSDDIVLEPHWAMAPTAMSIDLDYDRFWQRAGPVDLGGRSVPTLGPDDLLLVLCVHGSKHEWTRLQWICDVAALVQRFPELDLAEILDDARSRGLARMLLLGLGLAERMLRVRMPAVVAERLASDSNVNRLIETLTNRLFEGGIETSPTTEISRLRLDMRERLLDRTKYVVRTVLTPTEKHYRLCALPPALWALYVPVKIAHDYIALPAWRLWRCIGSAPTSARSRDIHAR